MYELGDICKMNKICDECKKIIEHENGIEITFFPLDEEIIFTKFFHNHCYPHSLSINSECYECHELFGDAEDTISVYINENSFGPELGDRCETHIQLHNKCFPKLLRRHQKELDFRFIKGKSNLKDGKT